ncbi:MAG: orotidine-5'-phosphate decarboxylase [Bdellovibrionales bacterium]|nr:orotidine-5'-phosphate decarboxylase [Bdellovibrionales bacterium]
MATELVVALDYSDRKSAEILMDELHGLPIIYKIGLELFMSVDAQWIQAITASGERVFLDLKFHDIPNTVSQAAVRASKLGAEFLTVHLAGGKRMLDELDIRLQEAMIAGEITRRPKILGVSVLTSFLEEEWVANVSRMAKLTGVRTIQDTVNHFADLAHSHPAIQGMVCSPKEIETVRFKYPELYLMIPGVRMEGSALHDQARVMTPSQAMKAGASAIVVGRPISRSENPRKIVEDYLREIS